MTFAPLSLDEIKRFASQLLREHNLTDWHFTIRTYKRRLGLCNYDRKEISISLTLATRGVPETIYETIRHEIAHAIAGWEAAHGNEWKVIAARLGCKQLSACAKGDVPRADGRWQATCPTCRQQFHYYRKPKYLTGRYCLTCGPKLGLITIRPVNPDPLKPLRDLFD